MTSVDISEHHGSEGDSVLVVMSLVDLNSQSPESIHLALILNDSVASAKC